MKIKHFGETPITGLGETPITGLGETPIVGIGDIPITGFYKKQINKMKILYSIGFILVLALNAFSQTAQTVDDLKKEIRTFKNANDKRYAIVYDKFTDKSSVSYIGDPISSSTSFLMTGTMISVSAGFEFSGNTLSENINDFALLFYSMGKTWEFAKDREIYALADTERFELGRGLYESDITRSLFSGYRTNEVLAIKITREQLEKFANAKSFEVKVADRAFKINDKTQKGFQNLLKLATVK